jgi:hypothetical protein
MKRFVILALFCLPALQNFAQTESPKKTTISQASLKEATSIKAVLKDFDFDATCAIVSYVVVVVPRRDDPVQYNITGGALPPNLRQKFKTLEAGSMVSFMNIKSFCPQDLNDRNIGSLNFMVK